jgi:hypothetical protein
MGQNVRFNDRKTPQAQKANYSGDKMVQHLVLLSGAIHHEGVYPTSAEHRSYLSDSGISPSYVAHMSDRSG